MVAINGTIWETKISGKHRRGGAAAWSVRAKSMEPFSQAFTYVYNARNQLVAVKNSTGAVIAQYTYDARGYRISESYPQGGNGVAAGTVNYIYYDSSWQAIETRTNGTAAGDVTGQTVWSAAYINAAILQDTYSAGVVQPNARMYFEQDANWDTTAIVGYNATSGTWGVTQRYTYTPYGTITILNADWSAPASGTQPVVNNLYQGMTLDSVTGLYYSRNRNYDTSLGTWISQDPLQYINGADTYQFVMGNPVGKVDPMGLLTKGQPTCPCQARALRAFKQAARRAVMQYNQQLGDFQTANAEQNYAQKDQATINFLASSGIGLLTGAGIGAAGEAVNQAVEGGTATAQSLAGQTAQDYLNGLASEQDVASASQFATSMVSNSQAARNVATLAQGGAAFAATALTNYAMGGSAVQGEDAVQGLLAMLPDSAAVLPTILDQATAGLLMNTHLSGNDMAPGSGQAFNFLNRGLQAARAQFNTDLSNCHC